MQQVNEHTKLLSQVQVKLMMDEGESLIRAKEEEIISFTNGMNYAINSKNLSDSTVSSIQRMKSNQRERQALTTKSYDPALQNVELAANRLNYLKNLKSSESANSQHQESRLPLFPSV
jgi:hypothetical protein